MAVTWEMGLRDHNHGFAKYSAPNMWVGDMEVEKEIGAPIPGILQVRTLEWVAISFS